MLLHDARHWEASNVLCHWGALTLSGPTSDIDRPAMAALHAADEVNHRVKNSLASVASMLRAQARTAGPEAKAPLLQAADRIHVIAAVHAMLYRSGAYESIDFATYLAELCDGLNASLLDESRIVLTVRAEPAHVAADVAGPLGMIVNELVTNAAKHAYPNGAGPVRVSCAAVDGCLRIVVSDDGVGLPAEGLVHQGSRSKGLGARLIDALAQQVGARVLMRPGPGSTFVITAPLG